MTDVRSDVKLLPVLPDCVSLCVSLTATKPLGWNECFSGRLMADLSFRAHPWHIAIPACPLDSQIKAITSAESAPRPKGGLEILDSRLE